MTGSRENLASPSRFITRPGLIIFSVAVILRLYLLFAVPLYPARGFVPGYNDEPLHLQYVMHMASGGGWPTWADSPDSLNYLTDAYIHPPTYYIISATVYRLFQHFNVGFGLYGARLVSMLFGLTAGLFIYRTASLWFSDRRIAVGALAAGLLAPNAVIFTSVVTNDALLYCLAALAIHSLALCRLGRGGAVREVLSGAFIAAAVWAKMSGLTLIPLAWFAAPPQAPAGDRWLSRARVLLVAVMLIMPLLLRNVTNYGQLVPGQSTPLSEKYWPEQAVGVSGGALSHPLPAAATCLRLAAVPLMQAWGSFPEKSVSLMWVLFWGIVLGAGIHRSLFRPPRGYLFPAAVILVLTGFIWHNIRLYQVEFRLLTPAFPALATLSSLGADRLKMPPLLQALLWFLPILLLPVFYRI